MGIVIRQSAKTLLLSYMGYALGYVNMLILYPLALSPEQIGLQGFLISTASMFSAFACLGTPQISVRFFPYFKDPQKENHGFLFFLLTLGFCGFVLFSGIFLSLRNAFISAFSENAHWLVDYYYYLIPFTFIILFTIIFEAFSVVQLKPVVPKFIREILIRVLLSLGVLAILFHLISFKIYLFLLPLFYFTALIALVFYIKSLGQLHLRPNTEVFNNPQIKPMLVFSSFMLLANISDTIIRNIDVLMLSAYVGLKSNGIYSIAVNIALVIEIPRRVMSQVIAPLIAEATKNNDMGKIEDIYKKSAINQLIIGGVIFLVIWCDLDSIFKVIPHGNIYMLGKWAMFYYGLGRLFDLATGINAEIIGPSKYYRLDLFFYALLSLSSIGISLFLIPRFGLTGAAMSAALSMILPNTMRFLLILIKFKIQPFSVNTLKVLFVSGIVLVLNYFMPHIPNHFLLDAAVRGILIMILFLGLNILLKASEEINSTIIKIIHRFI